MIGKALTVAVVILTVTTLSVLAPVYAMGQAPGSCSNTYDDKLIAMTVTSGHTAVNVVSSPGSKIIASRPAGYDVTFTVRAASLSSEGNSQSGQLWFSTNANGYFLGVCENVGGGGQTVTIAWHVSYPSNFNPTAQRVQQSVVWNTLSNGNPTFAGGYNVVWKN